MCPFSSAQACELARVRPDKLMNVCLIRLAIVLPLKNIPGEACLASSLIPSQIWLRPVLSIINKCGNVVILRVGLKVDFVNQHGASKLGFNPY